MEALKANKSIDRVYIQNNTRSTTISELEKLIRLHQISASYVPVQKLNKLSANHQGVIAYVSPITFYSLEDMVAEATISGKTPLFLLLDELTDVRNFGAIIRTAECTGVSGIIIQKKGGAPVNSDTVKTSAGAIFKVPICKVDHIKDAVYYLQGSGIKTIAATEKTDKNLYDISFTEPCAIIMGSEGKGINPSVLKIVDEKARLPLMGDIGSLNVSVACGAFLYEVVRQRL